MFLLALNDSSQAPSGFDAKRFQAAREQLDAKRLRMMAKVWPSLPKALGDDWRRQSRAVLRGVRRRGGEHALADGFLVAKSLGMQGPLPRELRIQMLLVRVRYRWCAGELVPHGQPAWLLDLISWSIEKLFALHSQTKARFGLSEGH